MITPGPASSFATTCVTRIGRHPVPVKTPRTVSKSLPAVSKVTVPLAEAVHAYQTARPPSDPSMLGALPSMPEETSDPLSEPVDPEMPCAASGDVFGGVSVGGSTVHATVGGEGSVLPAASVARTVSVWRPLDRVITSGEVQAANPPPSRLHANRAPASDAVNV